MLAGVNEEAGPAFTGRAYALVYAFTPVDVTPIDAESDKGESVTGI